MNASQVAQEIMQALGWMFVFLAICQVAVVVGAIKMFKLLKGKGE